MASAFTLFGELKVDTRSFELSLRRSADGLKKTERELTRTENAARRAGSATGRASRDIDRLQASSQRAARSAAELGSAIGRYGTLAVTAIGAFAIKTAVDMDSLKRGLTAVSGSAEEMQRQMVRLKEVAKSPGLGFKEAIQGSINLQAAGLSANLAERSLTAFGNALATVGKGKAELDGVITALSQIQSKGKISAEEINQLAERLPQIRQAMKSAFGTADTEALEKLGITSQQFVEKVVTEFEKLPKTVGGAKDAFDNFSDTVQRAVTPLGDALLNVITPAMGELANELEKDRPDLKAAASGLGERLGKLVGQGIVEGVKQLPNLTDEIVNQMKPPSGGTVPIFMRFGKSLIEGIVQGFRQVDTNAFWNELRNSWLYSLTTIGPQLTAKAQQIGRDLVMGLINGIRSLFGEVRATMGELGSIAETAARARLDTRSPSKVFFAIGRDVAQGFIDGIESLKTGVFAAMAGLLDVSTIKTLTKRDKAGVELLSEMIRELDQLLPRTHMEAALAELTAKKYEGMNKQLKEMILLLAKKRDLLDAPKKYLDQIRERFGNTLDADTGGDGSGRKDGGVMEFLVPPALVVDANPFQKLMDMLNPMPVLKPAWDGFWATMQQRLEYFKSTLPSLKQALGENLVNTLYQIGDVFAQAVMQWDGTAKGFFKSLAQGFRQLISQLISELIRLMVMKAVLQLIGAIAGGIGGGGGTSNHAGVNGGLGNLGGMGDIDFGAAAPMGGGGVAANIAGGFAAPAMAMAGGGSVANSTFNNSVTVNLAGGGGTAQTAEQVARVVMLKLSQMQNRNK